LLQVEKQFPHLRLSGASHTIIGISINAEIAIFNKPVKEDVYVYYC
jgi:hypothetical protein